MPVLMIIDDDPGITELITVYAEVWQWRAIASPSLAEALPLIMQTPPDLIVLDWQLPDSTGLHSLQRLRDMTAVPILVLTVNDKEADIIRALQQGADDYVVKPFSPGQVMARLSALLRRNVAGAEPPRSAFWLVRDLEIDKEKHQIKQQGHLLDLTVLEFDLISTMAQSPGRVWTREELLHHIWGDVGEAFDRAVDAEIARLRKKLHDPAEDPLYIETGRGVGYRWREEDPPVRSV
jgi:DNA-binding response OmpR family regulator